MTANNNLKGVSDKATRDLLHRACEAGADVQQSRNGHFIVRGPNGGQVVVWGTGHHRGRALLNIRSQMRRIGLNV